MKKIITTSCLSLFALGSANAVVIAYDETIDGDLGAPTSPTSLVLGVGANTVTGQVDTANGDTRDAFSFTLSSGQILESIILLSYTNPNGVSGNLGNTGFFHLDDGLVSVVPNSTTSSTLLTGSTFTGSSIGSDLIELNNVTGGPGVPSGELGAGDYTFNIQNTSTISDYSLQFNVVPEPSSTALLGLGGALLMMRRRR